MTSVNSTLPSSLIGRLLFYGLQPALLVGVIGIWLSDPTNVSTYFYVLLLVQITLGLAEHFFPARNEWLSSARIKLRNIAIVMLLGFVSGTVSALYHLWLATPLAELRTDLNLDIWPHSWPLVVQLFVMFLMSEFLWYWIHRAEHRWNMVWRVSGHGAHHSFKTLGALNFGLNHPLELFFLLLPSILLELIFGIGAVAAGAAMLLVTQASIAHANLAMNTRGVGLVFTTNTYHICHHSVDLGQSNTNYGCAAIVWDRVFGTFLDEAILDAGTGPTEPSMWQKFLMPVRQPEDTEVAPGG
jgi:sterol desaturase/sphingolipid hydroxylase (fatty acid hydroxylase superfamily)